MKVYCSVALTLLLPLSTYAQNALPTPVKCEEGVNCVFKYVDGLRFKTLTTDSVVITVALVGTGKYSRADVGVTNTGSAPVDLLPAEMTLDVDLPKPKTLKFVSPEQIGKSLERSAHWANAMNSMGGAMARQQTTSQTNSSGTVNSSGNVNVYGSNGTTANGTYNSNGTYNGTNITTTSSPDYAAQARAQQNIAERNAALASLESKLAQTSLRANTIAPGTTVRGYVFFQYDKHTDAQHLTIPIGGIDYVFPFHTIRPSR